MPAVTPSSFRLQRVFAIALAAFRARWAPMLVATFLLSYLPATVQDLFTPHFRETASVAILHPPPPSGPAPKATSTGQVETHAGRFGPWQMFLDADPFLIWLPLTFLCGVARSGAIASLTASAARRDGRSWLGATRDTATNLLPLILIVLIVTALVVLGGILVVPGLFLFAAWAVAGPVQIVEHAGVIGSLRRSAELTRGQRWIVLGVVAIWLVADVGLRLTADTVSGLLGFSSITRTGGQLIASLGGLVYDLLIAALYLELRRAKEGVAVGELEEVFA